VCLCMFESECVCVCVCMRVSVSEGVRMRACLRVNESLCVSESVFVHV